MRRPILPVRVAKHLAQSQLFRWMQLGFVATLLIAIMPMRNMHFWEHLHIALPSFVLGWFLWLIVMTATWTSLKLITPKWKRWFTRVSALLLLGIPLSWSVGYGECGHGKFVYIGPEILIVPTVGFDCGARHAIRLVWDPLVGRQDYSAEIHDSPDMVAQTPYIIGELIAFPVIATLIFFAARTKEST
jgi:hypothetical protein